MEKVSAGEKAGVGRRVLPLVVLVVGFMTVWTVWGFCVARYPERLGGTWVRVMVRLAVWVVPAVVYVRYVMRERVVRLLVGEGGWRRGVTYGAVAGLVPLGGLIWRAVQAGVFPQVPASVDAWVNPILSAAVAEEILCRGVIFRELSRITGVWKGAVLSAVIFAGIHVPFWYFSGVMQGMGLVGAMGMMWVLGMVLAALDWKARTLVAPVVFHGLNNLFSLCVL